MLDTKSIIAGLRAIYGGRNAVCASAPRNPPHAVAQGPSAQAFSPSGAPLGILLSPTPRTPAAKRSDRRVALWWRSLGRAGSRAGPERSDLGVELGHPPVELGEPLVLFPQLLVFFPQLQQPLLDRVSLDLLVDRWMPVEIREQPSPRRQRGKEFLLAAVVGGEKALLGGRCGHRRRTA